MLKAMLNAECEMLKAMLNAECEMLNCGVAEAGRYA